MKNIYYQIYKFNELQSNWETFSLVGYDFIDIEHWVVFHKELVCKDLEEVRYVLVNLRQRFDDKFKIVQIKEQVILTDLPETPEIPEAIPNKYFFQFSGFNKRIRIHVIAATLMDAYELSREYLERYRKENPTLDQIMNEKDSYPIGFNKITNEIKTHPEAISGVREILFIHHTSSRL